MVLLVFFMAMRTTGMEKQSEQLTNIFEKKTDQRDRFIFQETKRGMRKKAGGRRERGGADAKIGSKSRENKQGLGVRQEDG